MKPVLSALILFTMLALPLHAKEPSVGEHTTDVAQLQSVDANVTNQAQIQQLVDHFRDAIREKNGDALHAMFLPGASWLMGLDKTSLAKVRVKKPDARQFMPDNYELFGKYVGQSPKAMEEVFDNIHIQTDGIVGIVYFDYRYLEDGVQTNHGTETWQVVHTDDGWKISAMLYSSIFDLDDIRR